MGKIKGWKKVDENIWRNEINNYYVGIEKYVSFQGGFESRPIFFVKIWKGNNPSPSDVNRLSTGEINIEKAKKVATKYMRSHPRG